MVFIPNFSFSNPATPDVKVATCGEIIEDPDVHYVNPKKKNSDDPTCSVMIKPSPSICQIRLDIISLNLSDPVWSHSSDENLCLDDVFSVNAGPGSVAYPGICGDNAGQHCT